MGFIHGTTSLLRLVKDTILESLFPVSEAERAMLELSPEDAFTSLYRAGQTPSPDMCAIFAYADPRVERLVWNLKYKKSAHAATICGHALHRKLHTMFTEPARVVVMPMPISKRRRRERGYNQCELLADAFMDATRREYDARFTVRTDIFIRIRHTDRQTLKNREERLESAHGLFAVDEHAAQELDKTMPIVVIDDVITTGSTMQEALETLRAAGFADVRGVAVAH